MPSGPREKLASSARWLAQQPGRDWRWFSHLGGYMLLAAPDERLEQEEPWRFRRVWAQLMLLSLLWGAFLAWLWGTAWTVFGDYFGVPLMQAAVVTSAMALWLSRRSLLAFCRCLAGRDPTVQNLVAAVVVLGVAFALLGLSKSYERDVWIAPTWKWICPMVAQRVLILTPVWGAWAMLIAPHFCKPADDAAPVVVAFAKGCTAPAAALSMILPLAGTVSYLYLLSYYRNWWRLMVPPVAIFAAIVGGAVLCRRCGGLTRRTLLASNFLTQLAFILAYLAVAAR